MDKVAIVGLGLIGGSLGLALKASVPGVEVVGIARREETALEAASLGAVDRAGTDLALVSGADIVVLACPLAVTAAVLEETVPHLNEGTRLTDVGSVKGPVVKHALAVLDRERNPFLGGHPMAGKEVTGIANADAGLFRGRPWILTPPAGWFIPLKRAMEAGRSGTREGYEPGRAREDGTVDPLWGDFLDALQAIGARPAFLPPAKHDRYVAMISHLPFLLSAAYLVATADEEAWDEASELASSGFRDFTRIGAGDPDMYAAIAALNRDQILTSWASMHRALDMFEAAMARGEEAALLELFKGARATRRDWAEQHPESS
jgi:prephenate dehydrogenase